MKLATMRKGGATEREMEVDQGSLCLQSASNDVIQEDDWSEFMDDFIYGPVRRTGDGLVYRMCIEVLDWWETTGDGITEYTICLDVDPDDLEILSDYNGMNSRERGKLENILEALALDPDDHIEEDEIPTHMVSLFVVPVSVPLEVIESNHGGGDDLTEEMKKSSEIYGDFRAYAWDISSYGYRVPIAMEQNGQVGFGVKCADAELDAVLKKHKETAYAVISMFGFYMDRPWNRMGWDGWHVIKEAKAFPGQQQTYEGELVLVDENDEPNTCHDCSKKKPCRKARTIYCSPDNEGEWICESCCEDYYVCPDCRILIPIQPQSYYGVDWQSIGRAHYCIDCASEVFNGPDCPNVVVGGTVLSMDGVRGYQQQLSRVNLDPDIWTGPRDCSDRGESFWEVGMCEHHHNEAAVSKYIAEAVEQAGEEEEFIFGPFEFAQFGATIGLYSRTRVAQNGEDT